MLKLPSLLLILACSAGVSGTLCPTTPISPADLPGTYPINSRNLTTIDKGTNCTVQFTIPNGYALLVKFSVDFQSNLDTVTLFDHTNYPKYELLHTGKIIYDSPFYFPSNKAGVEIVSGSGKTRFFMSYSFQLLNNFQRVLKNTGDYFPASNINGNFYYTISASSLNEKVIVSFAQGAGTKIDPYLEEYYVYDGDNINTATYLGTLNDIGVQMKASSGRSLSIVNFFGSKSFAYILGNDASTVKGYSKYRVITTTVTSRISGNFTDLSATNGGAYTFICLDCSNFYWKKLSFDNWGTIINTGFLSFQGQTPTHKREKLIKYQSQTFLSSQLPQLIPSNVFTVNFYMSTVSFEFNTGTDDADWKKPYDGRTGYIFSPNLWTPSTNNNFNYEFRDNSQLYNFTLNMNKMRFPVSTDQMTLKIGSGTSGNPAVNNLYPRDQSSNGKVMSNGNYMQVGLSASANADIRLSFEMQKPSSASAVGVMVSVVLAMFYNL